VNRAAAFTIDTARPAGDERNDITTGYDHDARLE
jgi:hypothetical protein